MHFSGPWPPVISFSVGSTFIWLRSMISTRLSSAWAMASRSGTSSMAMTRPAPSTRAEWMAKSPTGPQPQTATVSSGWMSQNWAACQPVGRMSLMKM